MTSYCIPVLKCQVCGEQFTLLSAASGNTFGGTFYTDGYIDAPMLEHDDRLLECPECLQYIWRSESEVVNVYSENEYMKHDDISTLNRSSEISDAKYFDALNKLVWTNNEQEIYLRTMVWWTFNHLFRKDITDKAADDLEHLLKVSLDRYRNMSSQCMVVSKDDAENLVSKVWETQYRINQLMGRVDILNLAISEVIVVNQERLAELLQEKYKRLLDDSDVDSEGDPEGMLLLIAEIYRELGRFEDFIDTLKKINREEHISKAAVIRELALSEDCEVGILYKDSGLNELL